MILADNNTIKSCVLAIVARTQQIRFNALTLLCALVFITACSNDEANKNSDPLVTFSGPVMGTWYSVKYLPPSNLSFEQVNSQIQARLEHVDQLMSTYKSESEVSRFNVAPPNQWFDISTETYEVITLAQRISQQTKGAFDITVAPLVDLWGFGPVVLEPAVPEPEQIKQILSQIGYQNLQLSETSSKIRKQIALQIDLSAIAKGFGVDQVADYLDTVGVISYMVEVGGEIRTRGTKPDGTPWRIAIESPNPLKRDVDSIVDVTDRAVATSGDYRNYFEKDGQRFSHTIDPKTGYPITHNLASVTVIGDSAAETDALATAFSVMGPDQAMRYATTYNIAVYFIVKKPEGFVGKASAAFISMTQ